MTSPDKSAAEVVSWRFQWLRLDGNPTAGGAWHLAGEKPTLLPSVANVEELVPKSLLNTSRAETAAANARAEAAELARVQMAFAAAETINISHGAFQESERLRLTAEAEVADLRSKLDVARETVTTAIQNTLSKEHARRVLAEIEGKSK